MKLNVTKNEEKLEKSFTDACSNENFVKLVKKLKLKNEMDYYNSFTDYWPYDMEHKRR